MHNIPLALALSLSLAAGYAGVRLAMPPQPEPKLATMSAERCRSYEILQVRLGSVRAAEEFAQYGDCAATPPKPPR